MINIIEIFFIIILIVLFGLFGLQIRKRNIILILVNIELLLISSNLGFLIIGTYHDNIAGQVFSLFILSVAAAEAAIGLALLIAYYRISGTIKTDSLSFLKG